MTGLMLFSCHIRIAKFERYFNLSRTLNSIISIKDYYDSFVQYETILIVV